MNTESQATDDRSDAQIISDALAIPSEEVDDSDEYWSAVRILQHRISASLLARLREMLFRGDVRERQLAADAIAQERAKSMEFNQSCVEMLLTALSRENSPQVLSSICYALGHHQSADAVFPLAKLQTHPDAEVRHAVVFGLLSQDAPEAIAALISLSSDSDSEVRSWAMFGLGAMTDVDSVPLREALAIGLKDTDAEVAGEAMVGLALRGDPRVEEPLLQAINQLHEEHDEPGSLILDAMQGVRDSVVKHPDKAWQPILDRWTEVGFSKLTN